MEVAGAWGHGVVDLEVFDHIDDDQDTTVPFGYEACTQLVEATNASDVAEAGVEHANRLTNLCSSPSDSVGATGAVFLSTNLEPVVMDDVGFEATVGQSRLPSFFYLICHAL